MKLMPQEIEVRYILPALRKELAIELSKDMKQITHANILLTPDIKIKTKETGTRHKAAERTAKQAGALAIAVSERRGEINIYYKDLKYLLRSTSEVSYEKID